MFGLGTWEIIILLVIALVFLGPDKLPEAARFIGKGLRSVRRAMSSVEDQVSEVRDIARYDEPEFKGEHEKWKPRPHDPDDPDAAPTEAESPHPAHQEQAAPAAGEPEAAPESEGEPPPPTGREVERHPSPPREIKRFPAPGRTPKRPTPTDESDA